jgi:hypothetical protein
MVGCSEERSRRLAHVLGWFLRLARRPGGSRSDARGSFAEGQSISGVTAGLLTFRGFRLPEPFSFPTASSSQRTHLLGGHGRRTGDA